MYHVCQTLFFYVDTTVTISFASCFANRTVSKEVTTMIPSLICSGFAVLEEARLPEDFRVRGRYGLV
jgi:thiamine transporter ThiT